MPVCNHCLQEKPEEEFNWRYKQRGIRHPTCRECQKPFRRAWYEGSAKGRHLANVRERKERVRVEAQEFVYQYLLMHPSEHCGESDPRVLEFHHIEEKEREISVMANGGYPINTIMQEINKCRVLCSNCHRKLTMDERGWFRGKR